MKIHYPAPPATCPESAIVIDELTVDEVRAHCSKCGASVVSKRERYSKKEWAVIYQSAKDHQNGMYK